MTPEEKARQKIDEMLGAAGWMVQDFKALDFSAGRGIALREVPLKTGPCDYLLLVDRKAVGVVEAKKEGTTLSTLAEQSSRYASSLPDFLANGVSVCAWVLTESRPLERIPTFAVAPPLGTRDGDSLNTLAKCLAQMDRGISLPVIASGKRNELQPI